MPPCTIAEGFIACLHKSGLCLLTLLAQLHMVCWLHASLQVGLACLLPLQVTQFYTVCIHTFQVNSYNHYPHDIGYCMQSINLRVATCTHSCEDVMIWFCFHLQFLLSTVPCFATSCFSASRQSTIWGCCMFSSISIATRLGTRLQRENEIATEINEAMVDRNLSFCGCGS